MDADAEEKVEMCHEGGKGRWERRKENKMGRGSTELVPCPLKVFFILPLPTESYHEARTGRTL